MDYPLDNANDSSQRSWISWCSGACTWLLSGALEIPILRLWLRLGLRLKRRNRSFNWHVHTVCLYCPIVLCLVAGTTRHIPACEAESIFVPLSLLALPLWPISLPVVYSVVSSAADIGFFGWRHAVVSACAVDFHACVNMEEEMERDKPLLFAD